MKRNINPIPYKDHRTFSFHRTFGTAISTPTTFDFDTLGLRPDQNADGLYEACTAYTNNDVASNEDRVAYDDYDFTYKNTLMMMDAPYGSPCDVMTALNATTTYGVKSKTMTADQAVRRAPFFIIEKLGDYLGGLISAMWVKQGCLSVATPWFREFEQVNPDGTVNSPKTWDVTKERASWHDWEVCGVAMINGIQMIKCKSWQGPHYGVSGINYFTREQINALLGIKGAGCFGQKHANPEDIKAVEMVWYQVAISYAIMIWKKLSLRNQSIMPPEPITPVSPSVQPISTPKYLWDNPMDVRHSIRVICDEEGLTVDQKNALCATLECESDFKTNLIHPNYVINKVTGAKTLSTTDYGLCQINDYWHIGSGKDFPSVDYVMNNPEACVRWMCSMCKAGELDLWVCHSAGLYKKYL